MTYEMAETRARHRHRYREPRRQRRPASRLSAFNFLSLAILSVLPDITRYDAFIQDRLAVMGIVHKPWAIDRVEVAVSFGTVMGLTTPGGYGTFDLVSGIRTAY